MKMMFRQVKKCPLCGGTNFGFAFIGVCEEREREATGIDEIYYAKCACGAIFHEWMMTDETLYEYYQDMYRRSTFHETSEMGPKNVAEEVIRIGNLLEYLDGHKRCLDIGSSTGVLLKIMRSKGAEVVGVEPNEKFREKSNEYVVKDISEVEGTFDFITIIHVLEHLPRPAEMMHTIRELLTDDGELLIEIPLGRRELAHPITFTEKTFFDMLRNTGFKVKDVKKPKHLIVLARKA